VREGCFVKGKGGRKANSFHKSFSRRGCYFYGGGGVTGRGEEGICPKKQLRRES